MPTLPLPTPAPFSDFPGNPVLSAPDGKWILADPTVLPPSQAPDGQWHLFAHTLKGVLHYRSVDGYEWTQEGAVLFRGIRPCIRQAGENFLLFYEHFFRPWHTGIAVRRSSDLRQWSEPVILLKPDLPWEGRWWRTNGNPSFVSGDFGCRLYYSAAGVLMRECLYPEPRYIGVAEADYPFGPYRKRPEPLFAPSEADPWCNLGAGAIKVFAAEGGFWGFHNGIYRDSAGTSRSAIRLLKSANGFQWAPVQEEPLVAPEPGTWKHAFVYACDVAAHEGEVRLYYNARDGWLVGKERIGVAVCRSNFLPNSPESWLS